MRKITISAIIIILVVVTTFSDTIIPGGSVSGTWSLSGSPYIIQGNCVINSTSTLIIEPGVTVLMEPSCRFRCDGRLLAVGTEDDSIVFTATDTFLGCEGVDFKDLNNNQLDSSKMVYCRISYGIGSPFPDTYMHGGGLYIKNSSKILISNCLISNNKTCNMTGISGASGPSGSGQDGEPGGPAYSGNGGAIYCFDSDIAIINCTFTNNRTGDAVGGNGGDGGSHSGWYEGYGGDAGSGGESISGSGGAIYLENSDIILDNSIFDHNYTGLASGGSGGAGGFAFGQEAAFGGDGGNGGIASSGNGGTIFCKQSSAFFTNCLLYANMVGNADGGDGGSGGGASTSVGGMSVPGEGGLGGNAYAGDGAVIAEVDCFGAFANFTIADNPANGIATPGAGYPAGLGYDSEYLVYGQGSVFYNSIIRNNSLQALSPQNSYYYCCTMPAMPGMGNITLDPYFVESPAGEYFLSQTAAGQPVQSPCVDAGNPSSSLIGGTTRTDSIPDAGTLDMGFHYFAQNQLAIVSISQNEFNFSVLWGGGNPPADTLIISSVQGIPLIYTVEEDLDWLSLSPASGAIPPSDTIVVTADISGLEPGIYEGDVEINCPGSIINQFLIHVTLSISNTLNGSLSGAIGPGLFCVTGNLQVDVSDTLIIRPGTKLQFAGQYEILVNTNAVLTAIGNPTDSIFFETFPGNQSWRGIFFSSSNGSELSYCSITNSYDSGIKCHASELTINHSIIADNTGASGGGIFFSDFSRLNIFDSRISGNHAVNGGGIYGYNNCSALLNNCIIEDNLADQKGGGLSFQNYTTIDEFILEDCQIAGNQAGDTGGGLYTYLYTDTKLKYCLFYDNSSPHGGAIQVGTHVDLTIENGTICANTSTYSIIGQDIYTNTHLNSTLVAFNNGIGLEFDYGEYTDSLHYCCFFGNMQNYSGSGPNIPIGFAQNSLVNFNSDSCDVYYNIFLNPLFVNAQNGDFHLTQASPAIDAGDPFHPLDPDGTIADIGYEYFNQGSTGVSVSGYCYWDFGCHHEGTKVKFTSGAFADSTFTATTGYYHQDVPDGVYDILFEHAGFDDVLLTGISCLPPSLIIPNVTLQANDSTSYPLYGPQTGTLPDHIYTVGNNIQVIAGDTLVIEPGAEFYFYNQAALIVNGVLLAEGTVLDSIRFLPADGNALWDGITIYNTSEQGSLLRYCRISGSNDKGILINGDNCLLANSLLDSNYYRAVHILGDVQVSECSIINNGLEPTPTQNGGGIYCSSIDTVSIEDCLISGNNAYQGAGIYATVDVNIIGCQITNNAAESLGGGLFLHANAAPFVSRVINCSISQNSSGWQASAVFCTSTMLTFNNTIVSDNSGGPAIRVDGDTPDLTYCDFYNNSGGNYGSTMIPPGFGDLIQTNANGDSCDIYNNIFLDPLFTDPQNGDFHLTAQSPCIDAGDPLSPLDPDSTIADIGAFYFDQSVGIADIETETIPTAFNFYPCYPNPFNPEITLKFDIPQACIGSLKIYDVSGREVQSLVTGHLSLGKHQVVWDGISCGSGVYFVRLEAGDYAKTQKIILLK